MKSKLSVFLILVLALFMFAGCSGEEPVESRGDEQINSAPNNSSDMLDELEISAAPGPVSYGLAYIQENNTLDNIAQNVKVTNWNTYEQLQALVTSGQVNITSTPVTNALKLYNKGVELRLINVSMWGMLYVVSHDENLSDMNELKGKEIGIFGKGGIHDLVFRHIMVNKGIDPDKDLTITYLELPEASARLAMKTLDYAVLNEPASSIALMNAKKEGVTLTRAIDLQKEWAKATGNTEAKIPMAGYVIVGESIENGALVKNFREKYNQSVKWVNENSTEAGPLVEKYFEQMKAPAVTSSLEFAQLESVDAHECREEIEAFFTELLETAPAETIGGSLPDDQFYYSVD